MAGRKRGGSTAVLFVDLQNEFLNREGYFVKSGIAPISAKQRSALLSNCARLLDHSSHGTYGSCETGRRLFPQSRR